LSLLLKDVAGEFVPFVLVFESKEEYQPENVFGAAKASNKWKEKSTTMHDRKTSITHYHCSESKQRGEQYHFNIALGYTQSLCIRNNDFILYLHDNVRKNVFSRLRLYPIHVIQQLL